jgi:uncharacterized protein YuzE
MRDEYFEDTDTLQITVNEGLVTETIDLDEDTLLERDVEGRLVSMTLEHARARTDLESLLRACSTRPTATRRRPDRGRCGRHLRRPPRRRRRGRVRSARRGPNHGGGGAVHRLRGRTTFHQPHSVPAKAIAANPLLRLRTETQYRGDLPYPARQLRELGNR